MPKLLPFAIWGLIGLGLLAGSAFFFWRDHAFKKRSLPAEGKIVSVTPYRNPSSGEQRYDSLVEWTDRAGGAHSFTMTSSSNSRTLGDVIAVRYDPDNPADYRRGGVSMAGVILGIIGAVFIGILIRMIFQP